MSDGDTLAGMMDADRNRGDPGYSIVDFELEQKGSELVCEVACVARVPLDCV
jgi:hypothetical protein